MYEDIYIAHFGRTAQVVLYHITLNYFTCYNHFWFCEELLKFLLLKQRLEKDNARLEGSIQQLEENASRLEKELKDVKEQVRLLVEYPDLHQIPNANFAGRSCLHLHLM